MERFRERVTRRSMKKSYTEKQLRVLHLCLSFFLMQNLMFRDEIRG